VNTAGRVEEVAATRPKLQQEVVNGIVAVGERREGGAGEAGTPAVQKARDAVEGLPIGGWGQGLVKLLLIERAQFRIVEQVAAVDEALRTVVVRNAKHCFTDALEAE